MLRETQEVERLETLGFAEVCGPSTRDCRERPDDPKEAFPGKGREECEGVRGTCEAWAVSIKKRPVLKVSRPIDTASEMSRANRHAGRKASWPHGRHSACARVERATDTNNGPLSPGLRTNCADRFQGRHAACHLCRHADMQTVIRAGSQIASIAARPKECSDAAPQHIGCRNPQET